ncbi:MAG: WbqC family protein [Bacteroidetes bacterium]|nr:WbqC family protein [Bacteroidota bacterium]
MKIAVMQPYFFPYLGYFQLINFVDKFVIFDDVQFINKGRINRNYILHKDKALLFTVPVERPGSGSPINEVKVHNENDWQKKFLKSLHHSYSRAPYFKDIYSMIENLLKQNHELISELAFSGLNAVNRYLEIKTEIVTSSSVYNNSEMKGQNRIIDICKREGADEYINLSGGMKLYSSDNFSREGIKLSFIRSLEINYRQFENEFVQNLSVIDNLMFNSPGEVKSSLSEFEIL